MPKKQIKSDKVRLGIKLKFVGSFIPIISVGIAVILFIVYFQTSKILVKNIEENLNVTSMDVVDQVQGWSKEILATLDAQNDALEFFELSEQAELEYIRHTAGQNEAFPDGIYYGRTNGQLVHSSFVPGPEYTFLEKDWYLDGLNADNFVFGTTYLDENTNSYVVGASSSLKAKNGTVRGVSSADIYLDAIANIVKPIQLGDSGGMFIVDRGLGMIIGHRDSDLMGAILKSSENDLYAHTASLIETNTLGMQTYDSINGKYYLNVVPVEGTSWSAVAYIPHAEVMSDLNALTRLLILIAVVAILILSLAIDLIVRFMIARPVKEIDYVARMIANGNLNQNITYKSGDEFGALAQNFNKTVARLRNYVDYINEITYALNAISQGDLQFNLTYDYQGEFSPIKLALDNISQSMNNTMSHIQQTSSQLTQGAHQVAIGAQTLSQGAEEQEGSIRHLAEQILEISQNIEKNADDSQQAKAQLEITSSDIIQSNEKMQNMIVAMQQISKKSDEIGKIIKTIEDIAFQTNILALNAAVEAARAGSAGKGFAVVADEVRNLASKSAQAAKNTTDLIVDTLHAVENGTEIAGDTAKSMLAVVENSKQATALVESISQSTATQTNAVEGIKNNINSISSVVQQNSASSEQSAAASEELSSQAIELQNLVSHFKLK